MEASGQVKLEGWNDASNPSQRYYPNQTGPAGQDFTRLRLYAHGKPSFFGQAFPAAIALALPSHPGLIYYG